ncbi:hypothetical protein EON65_58150 [archaeon]|nr:MAG: hypothetical protein EON65_58150 [archaeon]
MTLHRRGLRAAVYEQAGKSGAFHSNEDKRSIYYSSAQTLTVRVLFAERSQCGIFQSTLEAMVKRVFDFEAVVVHTRVYAAVTWSPDLMAVLASDYVSTDNPDSDMFSLFSHRSLYDAVDVDPTMQPLLWESANLSCFSGGCKGERCHLMSQTSYTQHASNQNNILIMSAENHARFDGYDPKIAIKWVGETDRTVTVHGEELTFCDIQIVCVNDEVFRCVRNNVKAGAVSDSSALTYTISVAVPTPSLFKQYLTFKYWETLGLQASAESENQLAKMARVRAAVTEKMRNEFEGLTIDLQLTPKNKRAIAAVSGDD